MRASLGRAAAELDDLDAGLDRIGVDASNLAFNLDLARLAEPEEPRAGRARPSSRPPRRAWIRAARTTGRISREASDLASSRYTCVDLRGGRINVTTEPVSFTRVRPGKL